MIVLSRVISVFLLVVVGYVVRKAKVLDPPLMKGLSGFVLNVAIPFTIIAGFDRSIPKSALPDLGRIAIWAVGIHLILILFAGAAYKGMKTEERKVLSYITVFSNCGFMGFPVVEGLFGKVGVMYASIYVVIFQTVIWTYGVSLFSGGSEKNHIRKAILNPGMFSVFIGLIVWLLPFDMPTAITGSIGILSNMTTPLSMILVGASLADVPLGGLLAGRTLWIGTAVRLICIPLVAYGAMRLLGGGGLPAKIAAFLTAMPAAAQSVIFAERYNSDVSLASKLVFVTTVLSAATVPLFALIMA